MSDPFEELVTCRSATTARGLNHQADRSCLVFETPGHGLGHGSSPKVPGEFKDLLPVGLTSTACQPPMRAAAGVWPDGQAQASQQSTLEVDGLPQSTVDLWFNLADTDKDGRVANAEAVKFFLQSGLSPVELRKMYLLVKTPELNAREGVGLNKLRFAQMLRLIALAQTGLPFTDSNAAAALSPTSWLALHGQPLPPPRILLGSTSTPSIEEANVMQQPVSDSNPIPISPIPGSTTAVSVNEASHISVPLQPAAGQSQRALPGMGLGNPFASATAASSSLLDTLEGEADAASWQMPDVSALESMVATSQQRVAAPETHVTMAFDAALPDEDDDDIFGLKKLAPVKQLSRAKALSKGNLERQRSPVRSDAWETPLPYEVRLPPLNPKQSAKLSMLAAGNGSLFAAPGSKTSMLQWAHSEGDLQPPIMAGAVERSTSLCPSNAETLDALEGYKEDAAASLPRVTTEDADAARSAEVHVTSRKGTTCLIVDCRANVLWVGNKEGMVSGYDLSGQPGAAVGSVGDVAQQRLLYQWEAYRIGSVASMCVTSYGELWTGSSRGNIRVWQLQQKSQSSGKPLREPVVCRELRRPLGERPHGGAVLALVSPSDGQLVWSTSVKGILLWDAASGAFLGIVQKMYGKLMQGLVIDHAMSGAEALLKYNIAPAQGLDVDPITGAVLRKSSTAERTKLHTDQAAWAVQTDKSMSEFVERVSMGSKQVVHGAGKAMKLIGKFSARVARNFGAPELESSSRSMSYNTVMDDDQIVMKGSRTFGEERSSRICALVATHDNHVWVGYNKGRIDRYTAAGKLIWSKEIGASLQTMRSIGRHLWVGFANGVLSILDADGRAVKAFSAHGAGIISLAQAGMRTYTLAADGSIKGWSSALPHAADADALAQWDELASSCVRPETLHMLCVTWNVGESKPSQRSPFFTQLDGKVNVTDPGIQLVVVGLQEIEVGGSSVALAAAKDALSYKMQERGNTNAKFWGASILEALGAERWYQVALRQLSGMLVLVFAHTTLKSCIGEVATSSVACGVLGVGGNKGAVAVEFTLYRRKVAAICSHFAAHQKMVKERNANYEQIGKQLTFKRKPWFVQGSEEDEDESDSLERMKKEKKVQAECFADEDIRSEEESEGPGGLEVEDLIQGEGMRNAKLLVWLGDFNYRIDDYTFMDVKERITRENWEDLLQKDQLRQQWAAGNVFRGLQEGVIRFRPTYKFDKGDSNPEAYDTSEKQRIPAWCDRIFFRGSPQEEDVPPREQVSAKALEYNCWLDVLDSDHKPVYARLEVTLPVTDHEKKRHICSQLLKQCAQAAQPEGHQGLVGLQPLQPPMQGVHLTNEGHYAGRFFVRVDTAAAAVLGHTADVLPESGLMLPGEEVSLHVLIGTLNSGSLQQQHEAVAKVVVEPEGGWDPRDAATLRWVDGQVIVQSEFSRGSQYVEQSLVVRRFRVVWRKR